ncbi:M20/M25/M40 family metallo-hydrolase [Candidatus Bathyarchaeota archaeon]|nr:M20/M25/M40 family metallo-hydrolase [Candidatus Bathyarchaeota archaeon]
MEEIYSYIKENSGRFVENLVELIKQPSVAATGEGIGECAEKVKELMEKVGLEAKIIPEKDGNPVVYGEVKSTRSDRTLLFYNHYDVQPPDPIEEWIHPPFSGKIEDSKIYGRGASDNKGNLVSRLMAVEAFLKVLGEPPANIKFVVEGEEEIGSPHLAQFIKEHSTLLSADACIWEFGGINRRGNPCLYLGLKGVLSVELQAEGAKRDVHSANAPLIPNPAWRLIWALNSIKNERDEILIEGFYERVEEPSAEEIKCLEEIPFEEEEEKRSLGLKEFLHNLTGLEALKALLFNPTCTINGFHSGYGGPGAKTVLPCKAFAKLDFRLVPKQMPDEIFEKLKLHLKNRGFSDIKIIKYGSTEPAKTPINHPFVHLVASAAEKVYGRKAVIYPTSAGSGPMHLFRNWLNMPVVSAGCSYPEAKAHAPNENLPIELYLKGIEFMATLIEEFGSSKKS